MYSPTIALCMIIKNEAANLGPLLQSVRGCFDEIHITDTGSTDGSLEFLEKINKYIEEKHPDWTHFPKIQVHHFEWVNDFAAAREYSFSFAKSDYQMWMDGDDVLSDAEAFKEWKKTVLHSAHYWVATYNYAYSASGQVECQFIRERVVKRNHGFHWKYFVHEGLVQTEGKTFWPQRVTTWTIDHKRTEEDRKADHHRNLKLFEGKDLCSRMSYYYGKELVENGFPEKAGEHLLKALKADDLELHDRILAYQYAAQSAVQMKAYPQAIDLLYKGLQVVPTRAEYWCLLGDIYLTTNRIGLSEHAYSFALNCKQDPLGGTVVVFGAAYDVYPTTQLVNISLNQGDFDKAWFLLERLKALDPVKYEELRKGYDYAKELSIVKAGLPKTQDIIFTCPPGSHIRNWDENSLKEKGYGGSETALIEVAAHLRKKTGKRVIVFQPRDSKETMPSGVEYWPISELAGYIKNIEPAVHIAWRHSVRLTTATTYVWAHDLQTMGAEKLEFDKMFCLSEFHRDYMFQTQGVPKKKVCLIKNGINPDDFEVFGEKDPLKVVFSSSPDRGLSQSIDIVKKARDISGLDIRLHAFYGFDNLLAAGHVAFVDSLKQKIKENDFVEFHGNTKKKDLMRHFKEAAVWLYPADFIETYCITAIEALCTGTYPIVRDMGALKYTMKEAIDKNMCDVLDIEANNEANIGIWANVLTNAIWDKKYQKVKVSMQDYTWERVADSMIKEFNDHCTNFSPV